MAITFSPAGVGTFTRPLTESRSPDPYRPQVSPAAVTGPGPLPRAQFRLIYFRSAAAVPLGQLPAQDLPGARVTADNDDGRLRPGSLTAHIASQLLRRSGGNA